MLVKLKHPETGETVYASKAGAEVLRARGYGDVDERKPKRQPRTKARVQGAEPEGGED